MWGQGENYGSKSTEVLDKTVYISSSFCPKSNRSFQTMKKNHLQLHEKSQIKLADLVLKEKKS